MDKNPINPIIADTFEKIANSKYIIDMKNLFDLFFPALKRVVVIFIAFLAIGAYFSVTIVDFVKSLVPSTIEIVAFSPTEVFIAVATVVIAFAVILTAPFFIFEALKFIMPALYKNERRMVKIVLPISSTLFVVGAIFGLMVMAFFGLTFFAEFGASYGIKNIWSLSNLISSFTTMAIGFGIAFQFPLLLVLLVRLNIVELKTLKKIRPHMIVLLLVVGAILTPPDVISQLLLAAPLYALYEGTLLYLKVFNKNKKEV